MSHAIPEPYVWDESFAVFYARLDEEHKGLFQGIFACCEANNEANLASLKKKVNDHFVSEEADLKKIGGYDFAGHKAKHDDFLSKLNPLEAPLDAPTVNFAKEWLVNHIKNTDFTYKGKM